MNREQDPGNGTTGPVRLDLAALGREVGKRLASRSNGAPAVLAGKETFPSMTEELARNLAGALAGRLQKAREAAIQATAEARLQKAVLQRIGETADKADRAASLEEAREHVHEISRLVRQGLRSPGRERLAKAEVLVDALLDEAQQDGPQPELVPVPRPLPRPRVTYSPE